MCLFSFKVTSPICKVTISILSILYLRSHMFWFCCGTGTLTSKGCLKKDIIYLYGQKKTGTILQNQLECLQILLPNCKTPVVSTTIKLVVITLAMHFKKTPSSILLLNRLHVLVCTMPVLECPREQRWQAITTELGCTQLLSTMLLHLCDEKFSISPYVFKPWYVSAILYIYDQPKALYY